MIFRVKYIYMKIYRSRWSIQCRKLKTDGFVSDLRQGIIDVEHVQGSMRLERNAIGQGHPVLSTGRPFSSGPVETFQGVLIARRSRSSIVSDDCRQSARQLERRSRWRNDKNDVMSRQRIHEDVIVSLNIVRFADDPRHDRFEMSIRWWLLCLKVCLYDTIFRYSIRPYRNLRMDNTIDSRESVVVNVDIDKYQKIRLPLRNNLSSLFKLVLYSYK